MLTNTRQGPLTWGQEYPGKLLCPFLNPLETYLSHALHHYTALFSYSIYCPIWKLFVFSFFCLSPATESQLLKHRIFVCLVISISPAHSSGPGPWGIQEISASGQVNKWVCGWMLLFRFEGCIPNPLWPKLSLSILNLLPVFGAMNKTLPAIWVNKRCLQPSCHHVQLPRQL